jgi:hypothetical protein
VSNLATTSTGTPARSRSVACVWRSKWAVKSTPVRDEVGEVDFGAVEVVPSRQSGLEHQHRGAAFGQAHAVEFNGDAAGRAQSVDAGVAVAGVDEDLLVLLEPGIQGIPLEPGPAGQSLDCGVVAVDQRPAGQSRRPVGRSGGRCRG